MKPNLLAVAIGLVVAGGVIAADIPAHLTKQAERDGLLRVTAALDTADAVHEEALHARLGLQSKRLASWSNGLGQVGLLVTPAGLAALGTDPAVKSVHPDFPRPGYPIPTDDWRRYALRSWLEVQRVCVCIPSDAPHAMSLSTWSNSMC